MTVHADFLSDAVVDRVSSGLLRIQDTQWGFIVEEAVSDAGEMVADTLFKFVAFAALFGAGAQWLLPGSLFSGDVLVMKLGLSAVLVATAL